jgi:hypothetical protein
MIRTTTVIIYRMFITPFNLYYCLFYFIYSRDCVHFMAISILIYISRSSRIIKQRERQRAKRATASSASDSELRERQRAPRATASVISSAVHSYLRSIPTAAIFIHLILDVREIYYPFDSSYLIDLLSIWFFIFDRFIIHLILHIW